MAWSKLLSLPTCPPGRQWASSLYSASVHFHGLLEKPGLREVNSSFPDVLPWVLPTAEPTQRLGCRGDPRKQGEGGSREHSCRMHEGASHCGQLELHPIRDLGDDPSRDEEAGIFIHPSFPPLTEGHWGAHSLTVCPVPLNPHFGQRLVVDRRTWDTAYLGGTACRWPLQQVRVGRARLPGSHAVLITTALNWPWGLL